MGPSHHGAVPGHLTESGASMRVFMLLVMLVMVGIVAFPRSEASAQQNVRLVLGFNEFAWPGPDAPVEEGLRGIDGLYEVAFHWVNNTQRWESYRPGAPAFLNDLTG